MKLLIIGDIFIDALLDVEDDFFQYRLGGIYHSLRGANAFNINVDLAYCANDYLLKYIKEKKLKEKNNFYCWKRTGAPGMYLISGVKELKKIKYSAVLHEEEKIEKGEVSFSSINLKQYTDVLIYPGGYDLLEILDLLKKAKVNVHIDVQYFNLKDTKNYKFETIFCSANSNEEYKQYISYTKKNKNYSYFIIKENRGGGKLISNKGNAIDYPCYIRDSLHSVGVGDVFNTVFIKYMSKNLNEALCKASYASSLYSDTLSQEKFIESIELVQKTKVSDIKGIRVPFDKRNGINIYIAGNDFGNHNPIFDELDNMLKKHNFFPRLPIRENGIANDDNHIDVYKKDLELLDKCQIMLAVNIDNDIGTMTEIGYFKAKNKPIILLQLSKDALTNIFVKNSCNYVCTKYSEVLTKVYIIADKILNENKKK